MPETVKKERNYRFGPDDAAILRAFRLNPRMTVPQLHKVVAHVRGTPKGNDKYWVLWNRTRALRSLGLLQRTFPMPVEERPMNPGHSVQYPTREGWRRIHELGFIPEPVEMGDQLSPMQLDHEKKLADLHIALLEHFPAADWRLEEWERLHRFLHDRAGDVSVNPDAFLEIETDELETCGFIELENSDETRDAKDRPKIQGFIEDYAAYFKSGAFREKWGRETGRLFTVIVSASRTKATNQVKKLADIGGIFRSERWYFADFYTLLENPTGHVWMNPKHGPERHFNFFGETAE